MATTAHGLVYPDDYSGKADVPLVLAQFATSIENALAAMDAAMASMTAQFLAASPVGIIAPWPGSTAPTGWKICDGTAHGSATILAITGSPNSPDLRDRFIVGAGGSYARGAVGGAATVTLTGAQSGLRAHGHGIIPTSSENADHTHSGSTGAMSANSSHSHPVTGTTDTEPNHTHPVVVNEGVFNAGETDGNFIDTTNENSGAAKTVGTSGAAGGHAHTVSGTAVATTIAHTHPFTTGGRSAFHQHDVVIGAGSAVAQNALTEAHENRPPYYALVWIQRVA